MKLSIAAAAAALPLLASGYSMGGPFNTFGRPVIITGQCGPSGRCAPSSNAEQAFANLQKDLAANGPGRRRRMQMNKEEALRQQEWLNRAFGLAAEAASAMAGVDVKEGNEALRQQQEWLGRAFGLDLASSSSPRYEVNDTDESFQVALDVPGVKQSDIDIIVEENVLTIKGERTIGMGGVTRKSTFSKSFSLDSTVETDKITAQLNNGVLLVTAPKNVPVVETRKIPIMQVTEEDAVADEGESTEDVIDIDTPAEEKAEEDDANAKADAEA